MKTSRLMVLASFFTTSGTALPVFLQEFPSSNQSTNAGGHRRLNSQ